MNDANSILCDTGGIFQIADSRNSNCWKVFFFFCYLIFLNLGCYHDLTLSGFHLTQLKALSFDKLLKIYWQREAKDSIFFIGKG